MFVLLLIAVPALEVFVFIEVGLAIGWLLATVVLIGTSLLGVPLLRIQGRAALKRVSLALSERRAPGAAALVSAAGLLGGLLPVGPGVVTGVLVGQLVFPPTRT